MNPQGLKFIYGGADMGKWSLLSLQSADHTAKIYGNVIKGTAGTSDLLVAGTPLRVVFTVFLIAC